MNFEVSFLCVSITIGRKKICSNRLVGQHHNNWNFGSEDSLNFCRSLGSYVVYSSLFTVDVKLPWHHTN